MLRDRLTEELKIAMKEKKPVAVSTLRLILTAVKDRDIAARSKGVDDGISEADILQVLQTIGNESAPGTHTLPRAPAGPATLTPACCGP